MKAKKKDFIIFILRIIKIFTSYQISLSEFIQVRLHLCLDITVLETIREILFVGLMVYSQIVILRIALSWYHLHKPIYLSRGVILAAAVDWTEDVLQGIVPAILRSKHYWKRLFRNTWCSCR